jgi:uncharacterized transporter YbjL
MRLIKLAVVVIALLVAFHIGYYQGIGDGFNMGVLAGAQASCVQLGGWWERTVCYLPDEVFSRWEMCNY